MAILPWLVPLLLSLALITYMPVVSLWLPQSSSDAVPRTYAARVQ